MIGNVLINGQMYDWASIELGIAGMPIVSFTSIDYEDSQDVKKVFGRGRRAVGYAKGNLEASGKCSLHREAFEILERAVPQIAQALGVRNAQTLYDLPPVPVTVTYANRDKPTIKDVLKNVKFKSRKAAMSQNDEAAEVEMDLEIDEIAWNGRSTKS